MHHNYHAICFWSLLQYSYIMIAHTTQHHIPQYSSTQHAEEDSPTQYNIAHSHTILPRHAYHHTLLQNIRTNTHSSTHGTPPHSYTKWHTSIPLQTHTQHCTEPHTPTKHCPSPHIIACNHTHLHSTAYHHVHP